MRCFALFVIFGLVSLALAAPQQEAEAVAGAETADDLSDIQESKADVEKPGIRVVVGKPMRRHNNVGNLNRAFIPRRQAGAGNGGFSRGRRMQPNAGVIRQKRSFKRIMKSPGY